jgi:hypothetical protein
MPPVEDSSELSKETRAAGIAFAAFCTSDAGCSFMKKANLDTFVESMGIAAMTEMRRLNLDVTCEMFCHYYCLPFPPGLDLILDLEKPGTNDALSVFLQEIHKQNRMVGFRRGGSWDLVRPLFLC